MPDKLQVAIVGLGLTGASIGLALHRYQEKLTVVGHDPSPELASKAKRSGAVDRTEWNLISAVANADRVILALPLSEIRSTLDAIKADLRPGCIVVDTAEVKVPVMQWAAELLPPEVHFVGGHPIVLSDTLEPDGARADLFAGKLFCLTPSTSTDAVAVQLAADVAEAVGAKPFFLDAEEHDGLVAGVEHLPTLLAAALMSLTSGSAGWKDMRKLAANQFFAGTLLTARSGKEAVAGPLANRDHAVHWLDAAIAELTSYRDQLARGEADELAARVDRGVGSGLQLAERDLHGDWDSEANPMADVPTAGSSLREMFFGRLEAVGPGQAGGTGEAEIARRRSTHHLASHKCRGSWVARPLEKRLRVRHLDDLAVQDQGDPVGQAPRLEHVVGDEDDRRAPLRVQPAHRLLDHADVVRIEVRRRLVEQQHVRTDHHRSCQRHPLRLPARQRPRRLALQRGQPHLLQCGPHLPLAVPPAAQPQPELHVGPAPTGSAGAAAG